MKFVVDHIAFGRNPGYILPRLTHMEILGENVSGVHRQTLPLCSTMQSATMRNKTPHPHPARSMNTFLKRLAHRVMALKSLVVESDKDETVSRWTKEVLMDWYEAWPKEPWASWTSNSWCMVTLARNRACRGVGGMQRLSLSRLPWLPVRRVGGLMLESVRVS